MMEMLMQMAPVGPPPASGPPMDGAANGPPADDGAPPAPRAAPPGAEPSSDMPLMPMDPATGERMAPDGMPQTEVM
jgi:hypothetical protein